MSDDFDYLARNGKQHVIHYSRQYLEMVDEALPRDGGVYLVAGKALRGGLRSVARLPRGRAYLSPNYRWLGIQEESNQTLLQTFDMQNEARPGFRFEAPADSQAIAVHPSGEMVLCREGDSLKLLLPDGQQLCSRTFPKGMLRFGMMHERGETFLFSPCGGYLRLASNSLQDEGTLLLLRCPSLEVIDSCLHPGTSLELTGTASPATNHVALSRVVFGVGMTLDFYSVRRDKMHLHKHHVGAGSEEISGETVADPIFDARGKRFLVLDSDGGLNEFSFPGCAAISGTLAHWVDDGLPACTDIMHYAYSGDHVLVGVFEGIDQVELWVLRANDLGNCSRLPLGICTAVLANGMVLRAGPGKSDQELLRFEVESRSFPVVAELDSEQNRIRAVHARERSEWRDVTSEVGCVELNFQLEPKD